MVPDSVQQPRKGDLRPGTRVGAYVTREVIGRGGMGTVYRAVHAELGSEVAVKVLSGAWGDAQTSPAERFLREARAASRVRHINIVQVFDLGRTPDGALYYVMELLDGATLRDHAARVGPLKPGQVATVVSALASALDALHAAGVIHRDLKPANVFLVRPDLGLSQPQVKLLDFGVARLRDRSAEGQLQTASGALFGTPAYMSPEQVLGQQVDHRSDVYSLGVVAFELLTGMRPYDARTTGELALQQRAGQMRQLPQVAPALPATLQRPLSRALALEPARRHQRAGELAAELGLLCGRPPPQQATDADVEAAPSWPRGPAGPATVSLAAQPTRSRRPLLITAAVLLVLGLAAAVATVLLHQPPEGPTAARAASPHISPGGLPDAATAGPVPGPDQSLPARALHDAASAPGAATPRSRRRRPHRRRRGHRRRPKKKDPVVPGLPVRF